VRRDRPVLVSPWVRTDRQMAMCGGTGGVASGSPSRLTWVQCFEAGAQFHDGQGAGGGDDGDGLVQGQGLGRPAVLALGGVGEGGDVAADEVVGFGVPDGALEREVAHRDCGSGVPGGHGGECLADVGGGEIAEFAGADDGQDGLEDVLVFLDGLGGAALEPVGEPVLGGLPDGVVGVAGLGGDAFVELEVQVAEFRASFLFRFKAMDLIDKIKRAPLLN
jgi:hypothetical protein